MAKSYFITGGAGFIGLTFTKLMLEETNARITVLDKLTYASHPQEIEKLKENSRFRFVKGISAFRRISTGRLTRPMTP